MYLNRFGRQGKFCFVEVVCKFYFNGCSVNEFFYVLENVLKVFLVICIDEEEKSFIYYYSLFVIVLKCNKMINYDDLNEYFFQLLYVFREKIGLNGDSQSNLNFILNKNQVRGVGEDLFRKRFININGGLFSK